MRFGKSSIQGCTPLKKTIVLTITPSVVNSYIDSDSYSNCDSDSAAATTINDTVMGSVKLIVVYLDSQKQLYQADLGTITDIVPVANTAQLLLDNSNCVDINCATDTTTKAFGVITRENNSVVVYDFVNGAIVGYFGNYNRVITQCHIHSFNDIYTKLIIGSVLKNIDNNHEYNLKFVLISHNATGPIHSVLELGTRTLLSNTILRNSSGASCNSEIKVHILDNNMYITQINSQLLKLNIAIGIDAEEQKLTIDEQIALSLLKTMTVPADLETRQNTLKDCVYKLKEITQLSKVVSLLPLFFLISTPFAGYLAELLTIVKVKLLQLLLLATLR